MALRIDGREFERVDIVFGIDLSLTAPGVAFVTEPWGGGAAEARAVTLSGLVKSKHREASALEDLAQRVYLAVRSMMARHPEAFAVMESVLVQSGTGKATERAALWWMVAARLERAGIPVTRLHPTTRKSLALDDRGRADLRALDAAGRKRAGKRIGLQSMRRRWPSVVLADDNSADALVCAELGARAIGWAGLPELNNKNLPNAIRALGIEERNER